MIESQIDDDEDDGRTSEESQSIKRTIEKDQFMKQLKLALEKKEFRKKFEKCNPNIQLSKLKPEKVSSKHFLVTDQAKHPIYGKILLNNIIKQVDHKVSHEGAIHIINYFKGEKMDAFDENGDEINLEMAIENHVQNCEDCADVKQFKDQNQEEGHLTQIKNEDIPRLLEYSDKYHLGFQEAYKRIEWSQFPEMKVKVCFVIL